MIQRSLAQVALFRGIPAPKIAGVARRARVCRVARGDAFVHRGERLPGLCVLDSGELKLAIVLPERGERVLGLVAGRATFGEALALRRHTSSYDIVALADASIIALPVAEVEMLAAVTPSFARRLIALLAERTLDVQNVLEASVLQRAPQRLAAYLCSLAAEPGGRIRLPVSKTLVAALLGIKKETLSRLLRDLVERRLIAVARRDVTILDRARLRGMK